MCSNINGCMFWIWFIYVFFFKDMIFRSLRGFFVWKTPPVEDLWIGQAHPGIEASHSWPPTKPWREVVGCETNQQLPKGSAIENLLHLLTIWKCFENLLKHLKGLDNFAECCSMWLPFFNPWKSEKTRVAAIEPRSIPDEPGPAWLARQLVLCTTVVRMMIISMTQRNLKKIYKNKIMTV